MKTVALNTEIVLGGVDVSHLFKSINVHIAAGGLNRAYLTLRYDPEFIEILRDDDGSRYDRVHILGKNISNWVEAYSIVNDLSGRYVELTLHADREVLSINGGHPWEQR